jgi:hypothetical protein
MNAIARRIAIRNAVSARATETATVAAAPAFDLEAIAAGQASPVVMRRFLDSVADIDGDLMSVDQSRAAQTAEEALAPFRASFEFETVESKKSAKGELYLVMRGCEVDTPLGRLSRTVLAFGDAHARVSQQVLANQPIDVEVTFSGAVLKVVEQVAEAA